MCPPRLFPRDMLAVACVRTPCWSGGGVCLFSGAALAVGMCVCVSCGNLCGRTGVLASFGEDALVVATAPSGSEALAVAFVSSGGQELAAAFGEARCRWHLRPLGRRPRCGDMCPPRGTTDPGGGMAR